MDKIYTRPKIRIRMRYKLSIFFILLIVITIILLNQVIYPLISEKCIYKAKVLVTQISNQETEEIMKKYTYKDLVHVEEDTEGNITFLESNVVLINQIKSEIVNKIQNRFIETQNTSIEMKLGSFSGSRLFSNVGPNIKVKVIPSGTLTNNLETEFYSVGVNQSIHRIFLNIKCTVSIISPFETVSQSVDNKLLLSESVIVGSTPDNYYDINGVESLTPEDQLNFIN